MKKALEIPLKENATKLISPLILICIILQSGAAVRLFCLGDTLSFLPEKLNVACDPGLYPFLSYAMYSSAKYEGETVKKGRFRVKLSDGTEASLDHKSLGLSDYEFKVYAGQLEKDEKTLSQAVKMYEMRNNQTIQEIFLVIDTYRITKDGIKAFPETDYKTIFRKSI